MLSFEEGPVKTNEEQDWVRLADRLSISVERLFSSGAALQLAQKAAATAGFSAVHVEVLPFQENGLSFREVSKDHEPEPGAKDLSQGFYATLVPCNPVSAAHGDYSFTLERLRTSCEAAIRLIRSGDKGQMRYAQRWRFGSGRPVVIRNKATGLIQG